MFGDLAGMLKNLRDVQKQTEEIKRSLEAREVEGTSGDGKVVVRANGRGQVLSVTIDPDVVDRENVALLEGLVCAAARSASEQSQKAMQEEMSKAVGALGIPGVEKMLGGFGL